MKYLIVALLISANCCAQKIPTLLLLDIYYNHFGDTARNHKIFTDMQMFRIRNNKIPYDIFYIATSDTANLKKRKSHFIYEDNLSFYYRRSEPTIMYTTRWEPFSESWEKDLLDNGFTLLGKNHDQGSDNAYYTKEKVTVLIQIIEVEKRMTYRLFISKL
jgi:hypothetical protein